MRQAGDGMALGRVSRYARIGVTAIPAIIAAVLLGLLTARFVLVVPAYFVFAGVAVIILALVLLRRLESGVLMYFYIAALALGESPGVQSPNSSYKAGLMPSEMLLLFLLALWAIRMAFMARRSPMPSTPLNSALLSLGVVSVVSMITCNVLRSGRHLLAHELLITQVAEVGLLWCSIAAFFLVASVLESPRAIQRISLPVILLGGYFALTRLFHVSTPVNITWGTLLLAAAIALVYSRLLFDDLGRRKKLWFWILLIGLAGAAYSDFKWVSGIIAVSVVILVISAYKSKALAFALILLAFIFLFVYPAKYKDMQQKADEGGDFDRFVIWQDAYHMLEKVNPVLGVGPGNYAAYITANSTLWWAGNEKTYTTAHNNFVGIAAEQGFVGLAVFLWVIIAGLVTGHRVFRRGPPEFRWLGVAATALLAGMALACLAGDYLFPSRGNDGIAHFGTTVYTWLIMGAAVAAMKLKKPDQAHD